MKCVYWLDKIIWLRSQFGLGTPLCHRTDQSQNNIQNLKVVIHMIPNAQRSQTTYYFAESVN